MFVATPTPQAPPSRSRLGAIGAQRPQVFHLFLHDLRRVAIVLVLFWLSFGSMLSLFWAGRNTGYPNPLSFRELALPLVVGLLFVGRSPGSRQAMWLTRPVDWRSWLVAKLAIVGLVFVPRVAVQVSSYQRADLEAPIFWLATSGMVSFEVLKVVFFVALATLGRGFASYVFLVLAGSLLGSSIRGWVRKGLAGGLDTGAAEYATNQVAFALLASGVLLLALVQTYRRRDRRWLLGSIPVVIVCFLLAPSVGASLVAKWWPEEGVEVPAGPRWMIEPVAWPEIRLDHRRALVVGFRPEGLDPGLGARIDEVRGVWQLPGGETIEVQDLDYSSCVFSERSTSRYPGLAESNRLPCRSRARMPILDLETAERLRAAKGTLHLEIVTRALRETLQVAPMEEGARFSRGFDSLELLSIEPLPRIVRVGNALLTYRRQWLVKPPRIRPITEIYLRHRTTKRYVKSGDSNSGFSGLRLESGAEISVIAHRPLFAITEIEHSFARYVLEEAGSTDLADYELVDLEIRESEPFVVHLEIEDFSPGDYLGQ